MKPFFAKKLLGGMKLDKVSYPVKKISLKPISNVLRISAIFLALSICLVGLTGCSDFYGKIVYLLHDGIYTIEAKGEPQKITDWQKPEHKPYVISVSPDGKNIFYEDHEGLWIITSDGSNKKKLKYVPGDNWIEHVTWSPKNDKILFTEKDIYNIKVIDLNGNLLTDYRHKHYLNNFRWYPDGERILFADYQSNQYCSYTLTLKEASIEKTPLFLYPDYVSPDFKKVIDFNADKLIVMDLDGGGRITVSESTGGYQWSPDGRKVTRSYISNNFHYIDVIELDGGKVHEIASGINPVWSPDSERIVYETKFGTGNIALGKPVMQVSDLEGENIDLLGYKDGEQISHGIFAWSPEGNYLVYDDHSDGKDGLSLYHAKGTWVRDYLTETDGGVLELFWVP